MDKAIFYIIILAALTTVILSSLLVVSVFADSANSIFSNIQNFTVSGNNNSFIINANHNNGTKPIGNSTIPFSSDSVMLANGTHVARSQIVRFPALNQSSIGNDTSVKPNPSKNNNDTLQLAPIDTQSGFQKVAAYDKIKNCAADQHTPDTPATYITDFRCGHVTVFNNGTTLRQFTLIVEENHKIPITLPPNQIMFPAWTFNASIPGPTMRMTEGDHVQVKVINRGTMSHTLHMHSIHPGNMDGVPFLSGASGNILPGQSFTYDFIARPYGLYPYHCHADPLQAHINHGLYGMMIIDPKTPRPAAKEMVMLMNGYDLKLNDPFPRMPTKAEANQLMNPNQTTTTTTSDNSDNGESSVGGRSDSSAAVNSTGIVPSSLNNNETAKAIAEITGKPASVTFATTATTESQDNQSAVDLPDEHDNTIYSLNGVAFYYYQYPVQVKVNEPLRIYLVNMLDFEENSFHLHGQLFNYIPAGTAMKPEFKNDMITLGQGDRGILEFSFPYPGNYMIHAHFDQIASRGWMGYIQAK